LRIYLRRFYFPSAKFRAKKILPSQAEKAKNNMFCFFRR